MIELMNSFSLMKSYKRVINKILGLCLSSEGFFGFFERIIKRPNTTLRKMRLGEHSQPSVTTEIDNPSPLLQATHWHGLMLTLICVKRVNQWWLLEIRISDWPHINKGGRSYKASKKPPVFKEQPSLWKPKVGVGVISLTSNFPL